MHRPSSGEETLSVSSDDGLLSAKTSTTNPSVAQTNKESEFNSINSGLEQQRQAGPECNPTKSSVPQPENKNSTDISMLQCQKVSQGAENVEVDNLMTPSELMQLYQQSCSCINMVAKLSVKLFDEKNGLTKHIMYKEGKAQG